MIEREALFSIDKLDYASGKRPDVECIFCAVRDGIEEVANLEVFRSENFSVLSEGIAT